MQSVARCKESHGTVDASRRTLVKAVGAAGLVAALGTRASNGRAAAAGSEMPQLYSTTETAAWRKSAERIEGTVQSSVTDMDVTLMPGKTFQTMDGFGACFSELGWQALTRLGEDTRDELMHNLFAPGIGLNLSICRMPIGANDFALSWYSYNEMPGDFTMSRFDLARDDRMQRPFIQAAQQHRTDLKLWASPWSPPTWMKKNGHYAMARSRPGYPPNGLQPSQVATPGADMFIQDERYLRAYALYFRKFVEAWRSRGVPVSMVMPQNEFNSNQMFPSCSWTPQGLARFLPHLGAEMDKVGVDVFFGTLERADPGQFEIVMSDPAARRVIKGIGVQWAGRRAAPFIHRAYPDLKVYQTEQECGDGRNDWRHARYSWSMMREFLLAGSSTYNYWNIALPAGGISTWGWRQNSFITTDMDSGKHAVTHEYHVFKHLSHFVQRGARRIDTISLSGYDNLLAFRNPDGRIVVIVQNDMTTQQTVRFALAGRVWPVTLPADSINTLVF